jgi:tyrosine-protein phosphatase ERK
MQNTIYDFWLMVRQNIRKANNQGCQKIAMLTDFIENQRSKCAIYFPHEIDTSEIFTNTSSPQDENFIRENLELVGSDTKVETNFNYFVVKNVGLIAKNGYTIRKLLVMYGNCQSEFDEKYFVYHYWFPDWPDHRSPRDIDVLLDLSLDLLDGNCKKDFEESDSEEKRSDKNPLPIIHCSAGIGRTGCLAAILNGLGQIRANSTSTSGEGTSVDVLGIVCNLRLQRGGMVQNSEQYELIHRSLCLYQQKLFQKMISL